MRIEDEPERGGGGGTSRSLERLAGLIADGHAVDWERELRDDLRQSSVVHQLRTLESIADFHSPRIRDGSRAHRVEREPARSAEASPAWTWGRLEVVEKIGQGTCAEVFRAHDRTLDRDVALKLLRDDVAPDDAEFSRRFLNEIRRLAHIEHPHIVAVHGAEECDGRLGMWMDLLDGRDLEVCLSQQGPFSAPEAALFGIDLCGALAAIHAERLVHRDIKASNVMRVEGGRIVLMDFSSVVEDAGEKDCREDASTHGTPFYMAPEVAAGRVATAASDIYSLGVLLYRLVSGRFPVEADNWCELRDKLVRGQVDSLLDARPDLPAGFIEVVDRALATEPQERWRTAGEMSRALQSFVSGWRTETAEGRGRTRRWIPWRWRWLAAGVLVAAGSLWALRALLVPPPFSVDAALFRHGAMTSEPLASGDPVAVGDRLFLELESSQPAFTYVLNEDYEGRRYRLFPLPSLKLQNPLAPGVEHTLPGSAAGAEAGEDGASRYWQVTSAGGQEIFMVIASLVELEDLEERIAGFVDASSAAGEIADRGTQAGYRGIGALVAANPDSVLRELETYLTAAYSDEVWVWFVQLENPSVGGAG
jgi:hypothetical protein